MMILIDLNVLHTQRWYDTRLNCHVVSMNVS